jgi:6-pyruvoyltetrahydropterin/6-carboxytetrahydropterin synthase
LLNHYAHSSIQKSHIQCSPQAEQPGLGCRKKQNDNYHGHNYTLIVKLVGDVDPETGYVIDLKVLNDLIKEEVTGPLDHSNLNLDRPEFATLNPSAENIARVIWEKLRKRLDDSMDLQVRLYETDNNFVEYPA